MKLRVFRIKDNNIKVNDNFRIAGDVGKCLINVLSIVIMKKLNK